MFLRESQRVEIADEFRWAYRFSVEEELFIFGQGDRNPQLTNHGFVFYPAFASAFLAAVLDAVFWGRGAETPAVTQQVNCFQKIGFPLPVPSAKKIRSRAKFNLLSVEIAVLK
jgi:hypothetical protein